MQSKKSHIVKILLAVFIVFTLSEMCQDTGAEPINEGELHSLSAALIDGDSGRVLYEKDGSTVRANASTTKILTCILALEYGNADDIVEVSKYAAGMPDVQLGIRAGEKYRLGDLMYSMMLESHNDVAVAIAEHIGGDVDKFSEMMNEKARQLGCHNSFFITPNGLDATRMVDGEEKFHGTTAEELATIMAYCIKNEEFLKITGTSEYHFSNKVVGEDGSISNGSRAFAVYNKNAFLTMMDGAISGKTGFTGKAGYCYVGALKRGDKTYIVALLGCGWPNNKNYKWSDTKKLMNYGIENFEKKDIFEYDYELGSVTVKNGKTVNAVRDNIIDDVELGLFINESPIEMLINENDAVVKEMYIEKQLEAPVNEGDVVGHIVYYLNGDIIKQYNIYVKESVEERDYKWCLINLFKKYFMLE